MNKNTSKTLGIIVGLIIVFFLEALLAMTLWNLLCPELFNLPTITYWQTCGLQLLVGCFFSNRASTKFGDKLDD